MKNVTLLGKEYEVAADPGMICRGCLFDTGSEYPDRRNLCHAAPCTSMAKGNGGRGSFIVVREAPPPLPSGWEVPEGPPATEAATVDSRLRTAATADLANMRATTAPPGRKDDSDKLDMTLLDDMPRAIKAVVQVMQWAITDKKPTPYERGSWLGVHADRYRAAVLRHWRDANEQAFPPAVAARFQRDKETELLHLAHAATSALMALENVLRELEAQRAD